MGSFLMLLAVLMKLEWAGILQMQLFQINQSEESSKITINAHTRNCPLHELPITLAAHYWCFTLYNRTTYYHQQQISTIVH